MAVRKRTACIITGGRLSKEVLESRLKEREDRLLIVVDGALEFTDALGLEPDYIVGDFDTVSAEVLGKYAGRKILRHPPEKNQTDTELAMETALQAGCTAIELCGAFGSRIDHSLANIFLLQELLEKKISAAAYDENNKLYLKQTGFTIKKEEQYGRFVSLLPLSESVENVTLRGFKYSLENQTFFRKSTLGISNEITEEEAAVEFENGIFLVVESKDE